MPIPKKLTVAERDQLYPAAGQWVRAGVETAHTKDHTKADQAGLDFIKRLNALTVGMNR